MKTVSAGQFKTHCLSLLKDVAQNREALIITKYGKTIARVLPIADANEENPLKNSIVFENDIIEPIGESWEANHSALP